MKAGVPDSHRDFVARSVPRGEQKAAFAGAAVEPPFVFFVCVFEDTPTSAQGSHLALCLGEGIWHLNLPSAVLPNECL